PLSPQSAFTFHSYPPTQFQVTSPFSQLALIPTSITERFRCGPARTRRNMGKREILVAAKTMRPTSTTSSASVRHYVELSCPRFGRDIQFIDVSCTIAGEEQGQGSAHPKRVQCQHC